MILGASILQLPAIEKAKELGLDTVVIDMNPNAIGFSVPGIKKEVISTTDVASIVHAAKEYKIDGIVTIATDMPIRAVAAVVKELNLVGVDEETALKATNKGEMRASLLANNVPIPKFVCVSSLEDYLKAVESFKVPFIVKPTESSGSRGIFEVDDIHNVDLIHEAYKYCKKFSDSNEIIIEEYMSGPEVSVETIAIDGVCHVIQITDKLTTGAPHFVEMGHSQPSRLNKDITDQIIEVTKRANSAIGIKNGASHTEIIVTTDGPKIVEIGARLGGDNINTHLVPLSTGINIVECCIKIAIGEKPDISPKWNKGSAIRYFEQHKGIVESIDGIEKAQNMDGIKQISIVHGLGEDLNEIMSSGDRMGFVIAQDETPEKAIQDCENALKEIDVKIGV
ncbi:ATP-grasp domain-containing protein [Ileibacterium valens]|uniref:ATP-grasp domain-containing protein n=1 Tax=Ileibacterium valens TaxID=1862668 RepID=UPI0035177C4C